jgi:hypothetical protein
MGVATSAAAASSVPQAATSRTPENTRSAASLSRSSARMDARCRAAATPRTARKAKSPNRNGGRISNAMTGAMDRQPTTTPITVTRNPRTTMTSPA